MTEKEAIAATKQFGMGVSAEIWCYSGDGEWCIAIRGDGGSIRFYNLDDLKRTIAKMKLALGHIQAASTKDNWQEPPNISEGTT